MIANVAVAAALAGLLGPLMLHYNFRRAERRNQGRRYYRSTGLTVSGWLLVLVGAVGTIFAIGLVTGLLLAVAIVSIAITVSWIVLVIVIYGP